MKTSIWIRFLALWALAVPVSNAEAGMLYLDATADGQATYYEYFSDGFARIDLRDPAPDQFRQRFHQISNPSVTYGPIDVFPNDEVMRFGQIAVT